MKPLLVLLVVFGFGLLGTKMLQGKFDFGLAGRIAMSAMLLLTSIGHFRFADGMSKMLPGIMPFKKQIVFITGLIEIAASIALLIPSLQRSTAWLLILFFIVLLPANIHAAFKHVDYEKGTYDGPGPNYLWFRIPLQILFISWVYFFAIKDVSN